MDKDNSSAKKIFWVVFHLVAVALIITWGVYMSRRYKTNNEDYRGITENSYSSSYSQLINSADSLSAELENCLLTSDKAYRIRALSEAGKSALKCTDLICSLPVSHIESSETVAYLNRVGEYSSYLLYNLASGKDLTEEETNALTSYAGFAKNLKDELGYLYKKTSASDSAFSFIDVGSDVYYAEGDNYASLMFGSLNSAFKESPKVNYDGAYSSHNENIVYKGLANEKQMKSDEILGSINDYFGSDEKYADYSAEYAYENKNGMGSYAYSVNNGSSTLTASLSGAGGKLISLSGDISAKESVLSIEEAKQSAEKFLKSIGMTNLRENGYRSENNTVSFDYIATDNELSFYGDTVRIRVSLEDGGIVGYDASGFYTNHTKRDTAEFLVSENEALKAVPLGAKVSAINKGYHLSKGNTERLCYEINVNLNGGDYLYYIDASNGNVIDIKRLTQSENAYYSY